MNDHKEQIKVKSWIIGVLSLSLWSLCLGLSGCTANFEETNTDPNNMLVGQVNPYSLFEPILYGSANTWQEYTWYWNNELTQFTAFTGGTTREEHRYKISDGNWKSVWNTYARYASNSAHMYEQADARGADAIKAVAQTMKVLFMSNLTDMYGDIPYREAFQGRGEASNTKPVFDSQEEVYKLMFEELEEANALYAAAPKFAKKELDGMYKGDLGQWRKFNNSLYLRLLCRVSGRLGAEVGAKMKEILTNPDTYPIFQSNADNAAVAFSGIDPYRNYFASTLASDFTTSGRKLTRQLIKMTVVTENNSQVYEDPRLAIWGVKNGSTQYNPNKLWLGTVAGCTREEMNVVDRGAAYLNHPVFCRAEAPSYYMDYAEVLFIWAEAALKGYIEGGEAKAETYYQAAVTASVEKWAGVGQYCATPVVITPDDITALLDSKLASWELADNKEELIANQKFLALFWIGMEAYHEYRRTEYPVLTIGEGTTYNDLVFPSRFAYHTTTLATNGAHAAEALQRMGGANDMKTPVWWSKQASRK